MSSLNPSSVRTSRPGRLGRSVWLVLLSLAFALQLSAQTFQTASYALDADPSFSFGATPPDEFAMAAAIQARLGVAISVVTSLPSENVGFAPVVADSQSAPFHVYGPSFG